MFRQMAAIAVGSVSVVIVLAPRAVPAWILAIGAWWLSHIRKKRGFTLQMHVLLAPRSSQLAQH
jgi:hypothetical protein